MNRKVLLHTCCGPCSTASIERLLEDGYVPELFFSNSNIFPETEYRKRLEFAVKTAEHFEIDVIVDQYDHQSWLDFISGYENEPERGGRCILCFRFSLERAAKRAAEDGYSGFATTLTVSPHKMSRILFEEGDSAAKKYGSRFLKYDFKKRDGFKRSIEVSKELNLYRQSYCGCEFSIRTEEL